MECLSVAQKRVRFISVHLVVRVIITVREVKLTDAVLWLTEQATRYFIHSMDRLVNPLPPKRDQHLISPNIVSLLNQT